MKILSKNKYHFNLSLMFLRSVLKGYLRMCVCVLKEVAVVGGHTI